MDRSEQRFPRDHPRAANGFEPSWRAGFLRPPFVQPTPVSIWQRLPDLLLAEHDLNSEHSGALSYK